MAESVIIVCSPVSGTDYVLSGSLKERCSKCGEPVWIASSSLLIRHDNPEAKVVCPQCFFNQAQKASNPVFIPLTPAQREELNEAFEQ